MTVSRLGQGVRWTAAEGAAAFELPHGGRTTTDRPRHSCLIEAVTNRTQVDARLVSMREATP